MRLWMIFVPAAVLGGLNAGYDAWRKAPPSAQSLARRECIQTLDDEGMPRHYAVEVCNCMMNKAVQWKRDNPEAEYTLAVHRSLGVPCLKAVEASRSGPPPAGVFVSDPPKSRPAPDPALVRRLEEGQRRAATARPAAPAGTYPAPSRPEGRDADTADAYAW